MAQILVSNLSERVHETIARLAKERGQSVEETARELLEAAVPEKVKGLGSQIAERFRNCGFEEGEIQELRGWEARPAEFPE